MNRLFASVMLVLAAGCSENPDQSRRDDGDTDCGAVGDGTSVENLVVDGPCTLNGTVVSGNVVVEPGGRLDARDVEVGGSIQADGAMEIRLRDVEVDSNVQLERGFNVEIDDLEVQGDLVLRENAGPLEVQDSMVGGNLQVFDNGGSIRLNENTVDGNLQCDGNEPGPEGTGNVAEEKQDQCAGL